MCLDSLSILELSRRKFNLCDWFYKLAKNLPKSWRTNLTEFPSIVINNLHVIAVAVRSWNLPYFNNVKQHLSDLKPVQHLVIFFY